MTMATRIIIMKDGFIQQIGTPREVYDNPLNIFVASFIGSPSMNLLDVTYEKGFIYKDGLKIPVTEPYQKLLNKNGYDGKVIVFGIRPEDIHSEQVFLDANPYSTITATITVSELLGSETMLYLQHHDTEFIARVDSRDYHEAGLEMTLGFDTNKAHFFDKTSGKVISIR